MQRNQRKYAQLFSCWLALLGGLWGGLSAQALSPASSADAHAALLQFSNTPAYLTGPKHLIQPRRDEFLETLLAACTRVNQLCFNYLRDHRQDVLAALPDNPDYWANFWRYIELGTSGMPPGFFDPGTRHPEYRPSKLFDAGRYWPYYQIAKYGCLDASRTAEFVRHLRQISVHTPTLMEKMIGVAMLGYAHVASHYALVCNDGDQQGEQLLLMQPYNTQERSFTQVVAGESRYAQRYFEKLPATPTEKYQQDLQLLSRFPAANLPQPQLQGPIDFMIERELSAQNLTKRRVIDALVVATSELSAEEFWRGGVDQLARESLSAHELGHTGLWRAWPSNLVLVRQSELQILVLEAMADIYARRVVPGVPSKHPPKYWRWEWWEHDYDLVKVHRPQLQTMYELCLVPDALHHSFDDVQSVHPICISHIQLDGGFTQTRSD